MERFIYTPPWELTRFGFYLPIPQFGGDEWRNPSIYITTPLGQFTFFYSKKIDRSKWYHYGRSGKFDYYMSPDHTVDAKIVAHADYDDTAPTLTSYQITQESMGYEPTE